MIDAHFYLIYFTLTYDRLVEWIFLKGSGGLHNIQTDQTIVKAGIWKIHPVCKYKGYERKKTKSIYAGLFMAPSLISWAHLYTYMNMCEENKSSRLVSSGQARSDVWLRIWHPSVCLLCFPLGFGGVPGTACHNRYGHRTSGPFVFSNFPSSLPSILSIVFLIERLSDEFENPTVNDSEN